MGNTNITASSSESTASGNTIDTSLKERFEIFKENRRSRASLKVSPSVHQILVQEIEASDSPTSPITPTTATTLVENARILMAGCADTGKSTIARQLHTVTGTPLVASGDSIKESVLVGMQKLIQKANEYEYKIEDTKASSTIAEATTWNEKYIKLVEKLWTEPAIQQTYERRNDFQLPENLDYFLERAQSLKKKYIPSEQEIIRHYDPSSHDIIRSFQLFNRPVTLIDTPGKRDIRPNYENQFQITTVIFCVSLSEYDMTCPEDESINRMEESLDLWERTVNDSNFEKVAFILTFTKEDLFEQKLKKRNLKNYFTDYDGNEDPIIAIDFITKLFISKNKFKNTRRVYTISVNATDTQATIKSLIAVKDAILLQAEVKERKHTRSKSGSKGGHRRTKSQF